MPTLNQLMGFNKENVGRWVRQQHWPEDRYFVPYTQEGDMWRGIMHDGEKSFPTVLYGRFDNWSMSPLRLSDEHFGGSP